MRIDTLGDDDLHRPNTSLPKGVCRSISCQWIAEGCTQIVWEYESHASAHTIAHYALTSVSRAISQCGAKEHPCSGHGQEQGPIRSGIATP